MLHSGCRLTHGNAAVCSVALSVPPAPQSHDIQRCFTPAVQIIRPDAPLPPVKKEGGFHIQRRQTLYMKPFFVSKTVLILLRIRKRSQDTIFPGKKQSFRASRGTGSDRAGCAMTPQKPRWYRGMPDSNRPHPCYEHGDPRSLWRYQRPKSSVQPAADTELRRHHGDDSADVALRRRHSLHQFNAGRLFSSLCASGAGGKSDFPT